MMIKQSSPKRPHTVLVINVTETLGDSIYNHNIMKCTIFNNIRPKVISDSNNGAVERHKLMPNKKVSTVVG